MNASSFHWHSTIVRVLLIARRYSKLPDISYIVKLISSQALPKTQGTRDKENEKRGKSNSVSNLDQTYPAELNRQGVKSGYN